MSIRLGVAPVLLIVALAVALVVHMSPSGAGSAVDPAPTRAVGGVALAVADMDRAVAFYSSVLFFDKLSDVQRSAAGAAGARARVVTLGLGAERIELVERLGSNGSPMPADAPTGDRWLQHVAIVVNDIDQAYLWFRRHHVVQISPEPRRLEDAAAGADGTRAFAFEDPDGHALEILQFPPSRGDARWQRPSERVFLGIDHTGIVVDDTERSLAFYRDTLGLQVVAASESGERERLDGRLRITTLRGTDGPAIELLEYRPPRAERADQPERSGADLVRSQTLLIAPDADALAAKLGIRRGLAAEDPDRHQLVLRTRR
jgi:catechol 2,3-dioxygenase-like lactoylglutathione lyase family enzyme